MVTGLFAIRLWDTVEYTSFRSKDLQYKYSNALQTGWLELKCLTLVFSISDITGEDD